ncbi:OLC1v1003101C1 [Oldenlandia corymbosa var. corymbosa]|uniref:OLC1v1003101C1 n=1 Tax=Oldenlandia corymbosa var. corymbosa TaxID=529605 RepID=A0AAV1DA26_OLDCO|nr:OLC1v1003101C1 [Oldenlandia corymbosa var. corymbosa]
MAAAIGTPLKIDQPTLMRTRSSVARYYWPQQRHNVGRVKKSVPQQVAKSGSEAMNEVMDHVAPRKTPHHHNATSAKRQPPVCKPISKPIEAEKAIQHKANSTSGLTTVGKLATPTLVSERSPLIQLSTPSPTKLSQQQISSLLDQSLAEFLIPFEDLMQGIEVQNEAQTPEGKVAEKNEPQITDSRQRAFLPCTETENSLVLEEPPCNLRNTVNTSLIADDAQLAYVSANESDHTNEENQATTILAAVPRILPQYYEKNVNTEQYWRDQSPKSVTVRFSKGTKETRREEFMDIVRDDWNKPIDCYGMFGLSVKLRRLKQRLREWNKLVFSDVFENLRTAEEKVTRLEEQHDRTQDPNDRITLKEA